MITTKEPERTAQWQNDFLQRHQLSDAYLEAATVWFDPLARKLVEYRERINRPMLLALNGCQGSGKTTVSDYLCSSFIEKYGLNAVALSLDDFYHTYRIRQALASSIHPLFATRGVPGTHDMDLLQQTLNRLRSPESEPAVAIPRFDKAADDRRPATDWGTVAAPVDVIFLEGWCLGALPQSKDSLARPLNALERDEDPARLWREYSNDVLHREFEPLYKLVDQWIMLSAPSFDCVFAWRQEQERKLAATLSQDKSNRLMDDEALVRFIHHFERVTRDCLSELPQKVHHLFKLNEQRKITDYAHQPDPNPPQ